MIRMVLLLARTSPLSLLFLAAALLTLASIASTPPDEAGEGRPRLAAALAPVPKPRNASGDTAAALRIALFDPERRPETISGSLDDLRNLAPPTPPPPANIAISGVLLVGPKVKAMLGVSGGPVAWSGVGADVAGWRVTSIDAQGAVLEHDGRSLTLRVADRWKARGPARGASTAAPDGSEPSAEAPAVADTLTAPDPVEPPKP